MRTLVLERGAEQVSLHVMDAEERQPAREGVGLGPVHAREQGPDQPGPRRHADAGDVRVVDVRLSHGVPHHRAERADVLAGGDLRHDAPERGVRVLRRDRETPDPVLIDDGGGGLVARRLDSEDRPAPEAGGGGDDGGDGGRDGALSGARGGRRVYGSGGSEAIPALTRSGTRSIVTVPATASGNWARTG